LLFDQKQARDALDALAHRPRRPRMVAELKQFAPCPDELVPGKVGSEVRGDIVGMLELRQYIDELEERAAQRRVLQHLLQHAAAQAAAVEKRGLATACVTVQPAPDVPYLRLEL
jgi:hypothetical protein